jgi:hypothetical protein
MRENKLTIQINKPIHEVFKFTITPPNSTLWIPSVVKEETNEWPIRIGTIYKLQNNKSERSEVIVANLKENEFIEWISKDKNYHCRYTFKIIDKDISELEYAEWVDRGQIDEPFTLEVLEKLKLVLED